MEVFELRNILIHKISEINDIKFLQAIKTILDSKTIHEIINLSHEQRNEIMASKKNIEEGQFIDNVELDSEVRQWLSEK